MPNNGTLRLPLSPIGLHDPDSEGSGAETPPDPVDVSTPVIVDTNTGPHGREALK